MHSVNKYGLLLQCIVRIVVCVSVCVCMLNTTVSPAKTMAEPIEMPFVGDRLVYGPNEPCVRQVQLGGETWRIRLNDPCCAAMRAITTVTLATCLTRD